MVKDIRVSVAESVHDEWTKKKGDRTWREVIEDGLGVEG